MVEKSSIVLWSLPSTSSWSPLLSSSLHSLFSLPSSFLFSLQRLCAVRDASVCRASSCLKTAATKQRGKLRPPFFYGELKRFKKAELLILSGFTPTRLCIWAELPAWEVLCVHMWVTANACLFLALRDPRGTLLVLSFHMWIIERFRTMWEWRSRRILSQKEKTRWRKSLSPCRRPCTERRRPQRAAQGKKTPSTCLDPSQWSNFLPRTFFHPMHYVS